MVVNKKDHTHKYFRIKLGDKGKRVYRCGVPGCSHYINEELAEGKISICWRCEQAFTIGKLEAKQKRPHCRECTKFKKPQKSERIDRLKELLERREL